MNTRKLLWEDKYSVEVEELDNQHKRMFAIINELLDLIESNTPEEHLGEVVEGLIKYKKFHFATEEKYFKEFNYDDADDHIKKHHEFNDKLEIMKAKYPKYTVEFAFDLIDFLEDWLINHVMIVDHKYIKCFHEHGLK